MVKVRKNNKSPRKSNCCNSWTNKKRRITSTMPWSILIWSLTLFHVMNCAEWVLAREEPVEALITDDGESTENYDTNSRSQWPDKWSTNGWLTNSPRSERTEEVDKWTEENPAAYNMMMRNKKAAFGIMGLATKRPHKTAAEIQHLPPQDAFMSVRGRKKRFGSVPLINNEQIFR